MLDHPKRIFLASARRPLRDELGFVLPLPADEIVPASELPRHNASLIVAPPWTGKTYVSEQLHRVLAGYPDWFRARLGFESLGRGAALKPTWWTDWLNGDRHACWIVDAIDEDERSGERRIDEILLLLEELPEAARSRLHALFFCRESEVPPAFLRRIETLYGPWSPASPAGLRRLRLAGLDRESARAFVGAEAFERVCRTLAANGLRDLASLPVVLEHLKGRPADEPLDPPDIWKGVLKDLLRERPGRARAAFSPVEIEDRFEVVQWLATVLTFSGQREVSGPGLETLIPSGLPGREFRILREAAREALRTAVFEPAGDGYRFAQDHVREWFAVLALRNLSLTRIRPLLTMEDGAPNPAHAGLLDLLARVTPEAEVRDWIESGPTPWTFRDALRTLDRLQELSRFSPWGLALWREDRLARLAAPGLGAEIARRLEAPLSTPEQELLLDVALAVRAGEAVAPALRILREADRPPRVRALAADLLSRLGDAGQIATLEPWVRSRERESEDSALPILALSFYRQGVWDFETTADFALSRSGPGGDWLQSVLSEDRNRRKLFLAGLQRDPERRQEGSWRWRAGLRPEDAAWLLQVVRGRGPARPVAPGAIPVDKVVRFLQDASYRLLRTADDLQAVVLEELRAIVLDAKEHLAMLYRPLEKGTRRRLPEDALQAYLYCRLTDRLSRGTLEPHPVITLNREPLATRNMRNDIKIEALSLDNRHLTLIVEVKWSDNQEVATSLVEQLGRRYLKESGLTHGIYLVGWCGAAESGPEEWQARLEEQARCFQQEEPILKISPILLDLSWEIGFRETSRCLSTF